MSRETDAEKKARTQEAAKRRHDINAAEQERRAREWLEKNAKLGKRSQFAVIVAIIALITLSTFAHVAPAHADTQPTPTFTPAICAMREGCDGPPVPIRLVWLPIVYR